MVTNVISSIAAFAIFFVLMSVSTVVWTAYEINAQGPLVEPQALEVPKGASVKKISEILEENNMVSNALVFEIYARFVKNDSPIQAGEYKIPAQISMSGILAQLQKGEVILHKITIPEGFTNYQIAKVLEKEYKLSGEITELPAEGYLLPETYTFRRGLNRQEMIDRLHKAKKDFIQGAWEQRSDDLPFDTLEEAIVLASIVEKETGVAKERKKVAGVFINRLRKNMRLQSDPTVIYALTAGVPADDGQGPLGRRLLRKDLDFDSPYNTYENRGLPPGPICNPGKASVEAVLNPASHDYLYFVADGTGGHVFGKTLDEHNKNVAAWRKIRRQQNSD